MKKNKSLIGALISVILIILLLNPQWLPLSAETKEKVQNLEKSYFLIERSGRITLAHILTLILMICVLWLINVVVKWVIQYFGKKSLRAQTIANLVAGAFHYLIVILGVAYDTDLKKMDKVIEEGLPLMYEAHKDLYQNVPVFLGVTALADSGVNLKFIVDVKEEDVFKAQRQLTRDIWELFSTKGIEIPFPQVVVHQG